MELLLAFLGGAIVAALIVFFVMRSVQKMKDQVHEQALSAQEARFGETLSKVSEQLNPQPK